MKFRQKTLTLGRRSGFGLALAFVACSGGLTRSKSAGSQSPSAGSDAGSSSVDDPTISGADNPADVTGAFLVGCSSDTARSFVSDETAADDVTACVVTDSNNQKVEAETTSVQLTYQDGTTEDSAPAVAKEAVSSPWQTGFKLDAGKRAKLKSIAVTFRDAAGEVHTAETTDTRYKWRKDANFHGWVTAFVKAISLLGAQKQVDYATGTTGPGSRTDLKKWIDAGGKYSIIFASSEVYSGNLGGIDGADAKCATLGKAIGKTWTWKAMLSTSKVPARDRTPALGTVFAVNGALFNTADAIWKTGLEVGPVKFTEHGDDAAYQLVDDQGLLTLIQSAWTGTDASGNAVADGTCDDWTSDSEEVKGGAGNVPNLTKVWTQKAVRPCNRLSRLYCFSEPATP